jgi:hypothetical protein
MIVELIGSVSIYIIKLPISVTLFDYFSIALNSIKLFLLDSMLSFDGGSIN